MASSSLTVFLLAHVFLLLLSTSFASDEEVTHEEGHVLVLDASNFSEAVKLHPFILVEFYAPWCGHCKQLAPEYEKAAAILKKNEPPIILSKVNADEEINKALAGEYGVHGFPTLKIFEKGGAIVRDYKGPREADGIVSYLKKQVGPASTEIVSAEEGDKIVEEGEFVVVGVFESYDSEEFTNFTTIASELRADFEFKHTLDASFLPKKPVDLVGATIRVFKKFDEGFNDFKEFTSEAVKKFLNDESLPSVVWFNKDPVQRGYLSKVFEKPEYAKAFLFIDAKAEGVEEVKSTYENLAKEQKGKGVRFLIADNEDGLQAMQYFGAREDKLPCIVIQGSDEKKYMLEKSQTGNMDAWLKDYLDGKVAEFLKSESVPEKNDDPVKIVVLETMDNLVLKSGKNVLLEFYAPWCGHCKKLAPILDEVAVALQGESDVVIAKMDATANDVTDKRFVVKGFPTLYLHTASGKVVPFDGNRTKDGIISFISKNKHSAEQSPQGEGVDGSDLKDEL